MACHILTAFSNYIALIYAKKEIFNILTFSFFRPFSFSISGQQVQGACKQHMSFKLVDVAQSYTINEILYFPDFNKWKRCEYALFSLYFIFRNCHFPHFRQNLITMATVTSGKKKQHTLFLWFWVKSIPHKKFKPNLRLCVPGPYGNFLVARWNKSKSFRG